MSRINHAMRKEYAMTNKSMGGKGTMTSGGVSDCMNAVAMAAMVHSTTQAIVNPLKLREGMRAS